MWTGLRLHQAGIISLPALTAPGFPNPLSCSEAGSAETPSTNPATPNFRQANDEEDEEENGCGGPPPPQHPPLSPPVAVVTVEPSSPTGLVSAVIGLIFHFKAERLVTVFFAGCN